MLPGYPADAAAKQRWQREQREHWVYLHEHIDVMCEHKAPNAPHSSRVLAFERRAHREEGAVGDSRM
ncbi:hypothetical protein D3C81_1847810 [compost metagenome]